MIETKSWKSVLVIVLVAAILSGWIVVPARATQTTYKDDTPIENQGVWNSAQNKAVEVYHSNSYQVHLIFEFTSVDTDADDYWLDFDFIGVGPAWPIAESIEVRYRWGTSGSWTFLCYFDVNPYDGTMDITSATSSTLQLRFKDCARVSDGIKHTWSFDDEPILVAHWN